MFHDEVGRGTALLIDQPWPMGRHLFFVLTDASEDGHPRFPVLVPLNSRYDPDGTERRQFDDSCVLHRGDHPYVRHESYIKYRGARIDWHINFLIEGIKDGKIEMRERATDELFSRIIEGAGKSSFSTPELRRRLGLISRR